MTTTATATRTSTSGHPRTRRPSQDVDSVPIEFLDATCYFITADAFDTLLQCTQQTQTQQQQQQQQSRPRRLSISTSTTHFFTGSLVCTDPPLVLATGTSVDVLEREWQKYYVLLDLNNVAQHGRLPSLFSTFSTVHAISRNYQLDTFGETHWMLLELAPLRKHIPSSTHHESRLGGGASIGGLFGFMNQNVHRTRSRSNSLPWPSPTPDEASGGNGNGSGSGSSGGDSSPSDETISGSMSSSSSNGSGSGNGNGNGTLREGAGAGAGVFTHPEYHPSHSVTFDRSQAACAPSTMIVPSSPIQAQYHLQQQQQQQQQYHQRGRSGRRSSTTTSSSASMFFRQPPVQSIHSLLRARLQCLYTASRSSCRISVRIYFGSTGGGNNNWRFSEGMMVALDDGQIETDDCWLLGGRGRPYLVCDEEYECSLVSGLAAQGVYTSPAATIRKMRLVRRCSDWDAVFDGNNGLKEWERVAPQAYLEVVDPKDERLSFSLGPVVFEPEGVKGREWVGTIPNFVY